MSDNFVGALACVMIFGAPVGAFVVTRVLAHRERIEMIRRGIVPPPQAYRNSKMYRNASVPPPPPQQPPPYVAPAWVPGPSDQDSPDRSLRKGIMLALIGLAILIGLSFIGSDSNGPMNSLELHPGPWLLGGLIPMFVGVAQIIVALLSGARLGPMRPGPDPYSGQYPGGQYSGPGTYPGAPGPAPEPRAYEPEPRTHSGYEELRRPTPPPDRR